MSKKNRFLLTVLIMLSLCSCGTKGVDYDKSAVEISKDNSVVAILIEDFSAEYYQYDELMQFVQQDVQEYNSERGGTVVSVGEATLDNGVVRMELQFDSVDSYNGYMPEELFVGTLQGAYDLGYNFNRTLYVAGNDNATIGIEELLNMGNAKVVVVTGDICVRCPSKIAYYSTGMTMLDDNTVRADGEDNYFIIYN